MAKTKQQKEQELAALKEKFDNSVGAVFTQTIGLTVAQTQDLRSKLREEDCELVVAKKSLIALMAEDGGLDKDTIANLDGSVAVVFGYSDEVTPAKIVADFAKEHELVELFGGVLEGNMIGKDKVMALSQLPSRQELQAKMVGSLNSPISGFVNVLGGNVRGLVQVLAQIKEQKA